MVYYIIIFFILGTIYEIANSKILDFIVERIIIEKKLHLIKLNLFIKVFVICTIYYFILRYTNIWCLLSFVAGITINKIGLIILKKLQK